MMIFRKLCSELEGVNLSDVMSDCSEVLSEYDVMKRKAQRFSRGHSVSDSSGLVDVDEKELNKIKKLRESLSNVINSIS